MTPGASKETADGMSEGKIDQIMGQMRHERYRFSPARRVYIPKKNGKLRPLGMPSWSDKLVGEVVRLLLGGVLRAADSPTGPTGSGKAAGATRHCGRSARPGPGRPGLSRVISPTASAVLDHEILLRILAEKIHDKRFLRLMRNMLRAGYLEDWEYRTTLSGAPQGGVVTPPTQKAILLRGYAGLPAAGAGPVSAAGAGGAAGVGSGRVRARGGAVRVPGGRAGGRRAGAWDRRVAGWLAGLDTSTALTIASWIARAREAGQAGERDDGAGCGFCLPLDIICSIFMSCLGIAARVPRSTRRMSTRPPACWKPGLRRPRRPACWPGGWAARSGRPAVTSPRPRSRAGSRSRTRPRCSPSGFPSGWPPRSGSTPGRPGARSRRSPRRPWRSSSAALTGTVRQVRELRGGDGARLQPSCGRRNVSGLRHIGAAAAGQDRRPGGGRRKR